MKRIILLVVISGWLASGFGCAEVHTILYRPLGNHTMCDMDHCGGACGGACGTHCGGDCGSDCLPTCGPEVVSACEPDCGPACGCDSGPACCGACEPACCETCGPTCGHGCYDGCGPISSAVFCLLNPETWCGGSCGEVYWGDFHGDPPDCCDPCDWYGNFAFVHTDGHVDGCGGGCSDGWTDGYVEGGSQPCNCGRHASTRAPMAASQPARVGSASRAASSRTTTRR